MASLARTLALAAATALPGAASNAAAPAPAPAAFCADCRPEVFARCGGFLEGATFDAQGTLWVVDLLSGKVLSVDARGQCTVRGNTGGQPNGAKFGPDGQLWIADKQLGLLKLDPATGKVSTLLNSFRSERLRGLNDLAFDAAGGVYFTEPYGSGVLNPTGRLFYLPPGDGARPQVVSDGLAFPNGVVVAPGGAAVWVGEYARKRVTSIPAAGSRDDFATTYVVATTSGGIGPDGMTLLPDGRLLAANFNAGEVIAFDAQGRFLGAIRLPGGGPMTTNVAARDGWLYITEASRGEVWRVRIAP